MEEIPETVWSSHLTSRIAVASHTFVIDNFLWRLQMTLPNEVETFSSAPFTTPDPSSEGSTLEFRTVVKIRSQSPSQPPDAKLADVRVVLSHSPAGLISRKTPSAPTDSDSESNFRKRVPSQPVPAVPLVPVSCKFWILGKNYEPVGECNYLDGYYQGCGNPVNCTLPLNLKNIAYSNSNLLRPDNSLAIRCQVELDCGDEIVVGTALSVDDDPFLNNQLSPEVFPDMKLVCAEQLFFPCHKHMLAARSDVFMAMFSNEAHEEVKCNEVHIEDVDPLAVEKLIEYVYRNDINSFDGCAHDLIYAAHKYNMAQLKALAINNAVDTFSIENVCDFITLGELVQSEFLTRKALEFTFDHAEEVIKSDRLKNLSRQSLKQLFEVAVKFRKE